MSGGSADKRNDKRKCYTALEVADALGLSLDAFYEQRRRLEGNGMPRSASLGRIRIPKAAFDAWLNRDHPVLRGLSRPANDPAPATAHSDDEHRAYLRAAYGAR